MKQRVLLLLAACVLAGACPLMAVTYTGTNQPGTGQDFLLTVTAGTTNAGFTINGSSSSFSHLRLKAGSAPTDTEYDYLAAQNGTSNAIHLEPPDLLTTNYVLRVSTPSNSAAHAFTVILTNDVAGIRSSNRPATKSIVSTTSGSIGTSTWQYFRVEIPTNLAGWRVLLTTSNAGPDLYVQRDALPTATSSLKSSKSFSNDIVAFTGAEATPGAYYIGVNQGAGSAVFTLRTELIEFINLTWDPGTTHLGTAAYVPPNTNGGDYYFRITAQNTSLGAWRNALTVQTGEADLYLAKGAPPSPTSNLYKSERIGSDGFIVPASSFNAGEDWYLLVHSAPGSMWSLVSGEPFVTDLGVVAPDSSSSSGSVTIGAEGMRFFRTTAAADQGAWRLWLNGATNLIYVKKNAVPLPGATDLSQARQMLVVPGYLVGGQLYFVGVSGAPNTIIDLDSRVHGFTDLAYTGSTNLAVTGFPYTTFRVQVPPNQLAWQINTIATNGNPNIALRQNSIPNESNNDAYSEVPGTVTDSITLVPDTLSDGTFYITVYSTNNHDCTLVSGPPVVPDIAYTTTVTNTDTNRVGWSIYKVSDIQAQVGSLGWDISVSNATPGTRIALRRNRAPGLWNYRNPTDGSAGFYDQLSTTNYLQSPDNPADVWYVGVYNPSNALGGFSLVLRELTASTVSFDGGALARADVPAGKWQFFRVDVPADAAGWDARLTDITSGSPQLVIRRERLPISLASIGFSGTITTTNWPTGNQWAAGADWTGRSFSPDGLVRETGRIITAGMGRPLEPGTYYVGVLNASGSNAPMSYTFQSRGIGAGMAIPVTDLNYTNGSATNSLLAARDLAVYRVNVPAGAATWKVNLTLSSGDALLAVARDAMPNITVTATGSATNKTTAGRKMSKSFDTGNEHFFLLPGGTTTNIPPGPYYLVVVSEGQVATADTYIGTGGAAYTLTSLGAALIVDLGVLETNDIVYQGTLEGGDSTLLRFGNLPDTLGYELSQPVKTGNPWMVSTTPDGYFPNPGSQTPADTYGNEGGITGVVSPDFITVSGSLPSEVMAIKARGSGNNYPDATYTLRIRKLTADPLAFDGGVIAVTNQTNIYQFFKVTVPPEALGWDVRLTNVVAGSPLLIISKGTLPLELPAPGWSPGKDSFWPFGADWIADQDWTHRSLSSAGNSEDGRILAMGMGQPLEPGTYYVGVKGGSPEAPLNYTLISRGIGDGFTIPVVDLPFAGGSITNIALPPREAAYYRLIVPTGAASWQGRLKLTNGEAMLIATTNYLPTVLSGVAPALGKSMQKTGDEQYVNLAINNQPLLPAGTNYFAVISEGQGATNATRIGTGTSSFIMESRGPLLPLDLGMAGSTEMRVTNALDAGEVCAYQFTVPPETTSVEVELLNRVGNPAMVLRSGTPLPNPGAASSGTAPGTVATDLYGNEGGWNITSGLGNANTSLITVANPWNGVYVVLVKARPIGTTYTNAAFVLAVRATSVIPLAFDAGTHFTTNQNAGSWRFFQFTVPTNALGWDLRLTNVTNGVAKLVVRRDALPISLSTFGWTAPGTTTNWPGTNQWAAGSDWTLRSSSADGENESGRILAMGMGQPLEPGTYFAGVYNSTTSNSLSYTIVSRGLGSGFSVPVASLAFAGGTTTNTALQPREADYYQVEVPAGVRGWKVRLTSLSGEALLLSLKDHVPNVATGRTTDTLAGKVMQKAGNEYLVILPASGQTNLAGGTYYLAVAGEGLNPSAASQVGTGSTSYELRSEGEVSLLDLGAVVGPDLVRTNALQGGESTFYSFTVPTNTLAVELRLEGRVGNPVFVVTTNVTLPDPGDVVSGTVDAYGNAGGAPIMFLGSNIVTMPNPTPGVYQLAIKARPTSGTTTYPDAACTLRVRPMIAPELNFSSEFNTNGLSHTITASLLDRQRAFYRVNVPTNVDDQPVIGWELNVSQSSGSASLRVRKDLPPSDSDANTMPFTPSSAVIVPPYLTPGSWFVEIIGTNSTTFTLTSGNLKVQRPAWVMPGQGEPVTTPGVNAPEFGDTGVTTNGAALPGDQGTDLEAGRYHFYAVEIPTNNTSLLAMQLAAISGNPDLILRTSLPPTFAHRTNGAAGGTYERSLTGSVTDYANWVPLNGITETRLTPGIWYLAVRAGGGANARYRLRLSTGLVQDLDLATGSALNQIVASNNWRYYRFQMPATLPENWQLSFSQQSGDVVMHLRDTIPPGNGTNNAIANVKDWNTDKKNSGPYASYDAPGTYTFNVPPLRPGAVYYVGFRATLDSSFSLTSSVSSVTNPLPPEIPFYGGFVTSTIPANGMLTYRIVTPADAFRWRHTSTHSNIVQLYLENGSLPTRSTSDDWRSTGANSSLTSQFLTAYPWLPSQTYYLVVTNTSATAQPFSLTMNGSNNTADDDADGMTDSWEVRYFGSLNTTASSDSDADGVSNLNEFLDGTDPTDRYSLRPRLTIHATNGVVNVNPPASSYTVGNSVSLIAMPNAGYEFTGWTGTITTKTNAITLVLTSNTTLTAKFRVPGDDLEQRIALVGFNAVAAPLSNSGASKESGEPSHAGNSGGHSLWWTWSASVDDTVQLSTLGSTFRTLMAIYTGTNVNGLTLITNSASPAGSNGTTLTFTALANTTYQFAVDGFGGATGTVALALSSPNAFLLAQPTRQTNDWFRFTILSAPGLVLRVEAGASLDNWTTLAVITNTSGSFEFVDTTSTGVPVRFYRGAVGAGVIGSTNPPVLAAALRLPDGKFQFTILGVTSRTVQIESSSSLLSFEPLITLTNITSPVIFMDTNAAGADLKFYRALLK